MPRSVPSTRLSRFASLRLGALLPLHAAKLILTRPSLLFWSAIPIFLTIGLYFWVIQALSQKLEVYAMSEVLRLGLEPEGWATFVLTLLIRGSLILASAVTFSVTSSLLASPFNDFLAEAAETHTVPPLAPPSQPARRGVLAFYWKKLALLWLDITRTLAATGALLIALLLSWIPGLNVGALTVAALLVTFQYVGYAQTRRGIGLVAGVLFLWKHFWVSLGFGAVVTLGFAIPVVSILVLPLAVVGGTLLFAAAEAGRTR